MAKRKKDYASFGLGEETKQGILGIVFLALSIFFLLAAYEKAGLVGDKLFEWLFILLGLGYYLLPILSILLSVSSFKKIQNNVTSPRLAGSVTFILAGLGLLNLISSGNGGIIGAVVERPLVRLFDSGATIILLGATMIIATLILLNTKIPIESIWNLIRSLFGKKLLTKETRLPEEGSQDMEREMDIKDEEDPIIARPLVEEKVNLAPQKRVLLRPFIPIPLNLLEGDKGKPGFGDIKANTNIIKRTLQNFGINVEMDEVTVGPTVTRYALKPAEGVKLSKILALNNDLALALAAHPIRIEAPIPGKSLVGIEIPNSVKTTVGLGSLLSNDEFQSSEKSLLAALGKSISGKAHFGNISKMPHLLIAGATGSGKSVSIHAIIVSLLYRNSPENMKFIMIDPKRVELTLYNKIPHLLTPVITDAKKAIMTLKWATREMERRYNILEENSVRDIDSYHKNIFGPALKESQKKKNIDEMGGQLPDHMPYIVIIIDELADIMSTYPRELEAAIVRLAQMSRAVGIHLILSTQRPSVNVITGLIKANVPSRIALQVASQIDSRTILDSSGAEKLLGAGDMLYLSGDMAHPTRLQSAFISENEVKKVVKFLKENYEEYPDEIHVEGLNSSSTAPSLEEDDIDDDLYEEAREEVLRANKASTSYLQRKLRIGYARAARLIDLLEEKGVIGPGEGAKPREVIGAQTSASNPDMGENEINSIK